VRNREMAQGFVLHRQRRRRASGTILEIGELSRPKVLGYTVWCERNGVENSVK